MDKKTNETFRKQIYLEKTNNLLYKTLGILAFDILTYIIALAFDLHDFG